MDTVPRIEANELFVVPFPYVPRECGPHTLFVQTFQSDGLAPVTESITFTVVDDRRPPNIIDVSASPSVLRPPNNKMVAVEVSPTASDLCDTAPPTCMITGISSNEAVNARGDGNTAPDWKITGDLKVNLRAERSGRGNGRVYTMTVRCTDASGNSSTRTETVTVPHDQGKKKTQTVPHDQGRGRKRRSDQLLLSNGRARFQRGCHSTELNSLQGGSAAVSPEGQVE